MVAAEPVVAHSFGVGMEIRNGNTGIVAALSPDQLDTRQRVEPAESGAAGKARINQAGQVALIVVRHVDQPHERVARNVVRLGFQELARAGDGLQNIVILQL